MIRTFISARVSSTLLQTANGQLSRLGELWRELGQFQPAVKPIESQQLHVTLKFLGDTRDDLIPELIQRMSEVAARTLAFDWNLTGIGVFPDLAKPSVIWAGLQPAEAAHQIAMNLEREMQCIGFAPERRPFRPHVTLAYVKSLPPQRVFDLIELHQATDFGTDRVTQLELIESKLRPTGSEYRLIATAPCST